MYVICIDQAQVIIPEKYKKNNDFEKPNTSQQLIPKSEKYELVLKNSSI